MDIERVKQPTKSEFLSQYYKNNRPVILTDVINSWSAKNLWTPEYFASNFGSVKIRVEKLTKNKPSDPQFYLKNMRTELMEIGEFIKYSKAASEDNPNGLLYAAEVPITEIIPILNKHLKILPYWSNILRVLSRQKPRFWMGPAGCKSALHYDEAPNFIAQIWGRKKWVIFPKTQHELLYVPSDLKLTHFSPIDFENPDLTKFPKFKYAEAIEIILEPGEVLFLPEGWVHYVESLEFSMAINFWWVSWSDVFRLSKKYISSYFNPRRSKR